jgi:hypothetical protein
MIFFERKMLYYKPNFFRIEELVSKEMFEEFKNRKHILWQQFDPRILYSIDQLRDMFKTILINTWLWGGRRSQSGLRLPDSAYFSKTSQHSHGRGVDLVFLQVDFNEVREFIIKHPNNERLRFITCVETGTDGWLHIDCRGYDKERYGVLQVPNI